MDELEQRVRAAYATLGGLEPVVVLTIPGPPPSKSRPRFTRSGRTYADPDGARREQALATVLAKHFPRLEANAALVAGFVRPNRQRIDTDNMLKHVMDAANGVCFRDDSQVTAIAGLAEWDPERPRTVIAIGPHASSLDRREIPQVACENCGAQMPLRPGRKRGRYVCSPGCRAAATGRKVPESLAEPVPCRLCGEPFRRRTSGSALCSEACRRRELVARRRGRGHGNTCDDCGKPLAKVDAARCRDCWRSAIRSPQPTSGNPLPL